MLLTCYISSCKHILKISNANSAVLVGCRGPYQASRDTKNTSYILHISRRFGGIKLLTVFRGEEISFMLIVFRCICPMVKVFVVCTTADMSRTNDLNLKCASPFIISSFRALMSLIRLDSFLQNAFGDILKAWQY
jgi:hypothetical protein